MITLHFSPLLPLPFLIFLGGLGILLCAFSLWKTRKNPFWRALTFLTFICALLNPSLREETRTPLPSTALIVVDESASQNFGARKDLTAKALSALETALKRFKNIEVKIVEGEATTSRTDLFQTLNDAFKDIPESRRAGAILLTDGQIHDVPEEISEDFGPVHTFLSGEKNEIDRRITLINAPAFGIVGQNITITYKIEDTGHKAATARVTLKQAGETPQDFTAIVGEAQSLTLPVKHAGQNVFALSVDGIPHELTLANNNAALEFQGVRGRLRVLLVSGKPHAGGRAWRDLLTADPSVDLVHFTILRDPTKIDLTPPSEMSLIAFPFHELFEVKLGSFDLILFDQFRSNGLLPDAYFENIARYVQQGGAFLDIAGPDTADFAHSLSATALGEILPAAPTGAVLSQSFTPTVSVQGQTHPVTRELKGPWGPWLRQIDLAPTGGDVLMNGAGGKPLLILSRTGQGRVAQIASDQIWLWARGYEGGGPYTALLRRLLHWLMKEPELDEKALDIRVEGQNVTVKKPAYQHEEEPLTLTKPDGQTQEVLLKAGTDGFLEAHFTAKGRGIYGFETRDRQSRFAIVGEADPPEYRDVLTTGARLKPLADKTGGGIFWLSDGLPSMRTVHRDEKPHGAHWAGLRDTQSHVVTGAHERPLLPPWGTALMLLTLCVLTWWREGRRG